jgi:glutamate synthase domain-containing protein 1
VTEPILVQIPDKFFARKAAELGFKLPKAGEYVVGYLFMPNDTNCDRLSATFTGGDCAKRADITRLARRAD